MLSSVCSHVVLYARSCYAETLNFSWIPPPATYEGPVTHFMRRFPMASQWNGFSLHARATRESLWALGRVMSWGCLLKAIGFTKTQVSANRTLFHKTCEKLRSRHKCIFDANCMHLPKVGGTSCCALRKAIHLVVALMYFGHLWTLWFLHLHCLSTSGYVATKTNSDSVGIPWERKSEQLVWASIQKSEAKAGQDYSEFWSQRKNCLKKKWRNFEESEILSLFNTRVVLVTRPDIFKGCSADMICQPMWVAYGGKSLRSEANNSEAAKSIPFHTSATFPLLSNFTTKMR